MPVMLGSIPARMEPEEETVGGWRFVRPRGGKTMNADERERDTWLEQEERQEKRAAKYRSMDILQGIPTEDEE